MIPEIEELRKVNESFQHYHETSLPLCAAENVMSDFVTWPLVAGYQERYIMGSAYDFSMNDNFIGADMLYPYYKMISQLSEELFHAKYTDVRTLTGMNAVNMLASALVKPGDNVMLLGKEWGGHASMKPTFERLGANIFDAPYILDAYDFDYPKLNRIIKEHNIKFLNIAPSDILYEHDFSRLDTGDCILLFDYSQVLGLIAAGLVKNPLDYFENAILYGGTHKTMPGPAHGIIMTNNEEIFKIIDKEINPKYLRNVQTHQVVSLLCTMIEMKYYGKEYQSNTVNTANLLGQFLSKKGFNVVHKNGIFTQTHQLFLEMSKTEMDVMFNNAIKEHITLNTKKKALFHGGFGIRLGLQEIARYNWDVESIKLISEILSIIRYESYDISELKILFKQLPKKVIKYTFQNEFKLNDFFNGSSLLSSV